MSSSHFPVLIIGAGLAGLTLARSLSKSNIPAIVFEASAKGRSPGYGLTLKPQAYRPLLALLGLEEDSFRRSVAVDAELGGKGVVHSHLSFDARTGNIVNGATGHDSEEQEQDTNGGLLLRANKRRLRNLLAEGIDVRWEHEFKHVDTETTKESTLLARFENGQVVEGSLLVAADGVHSKVRQQVLPHIKPHILNYAVINGQRRVSRQEYQSLYKSILSTTAAITCTLGNVGLGVSINDATEDGFINISWTFSRPAKENQEDHLFKPSRALDEAKSIPEEFYEELNQLGTLAQPFKEVFEPEKARMDKLYSWLMRSIPVSKADVISLPSNIILMGDAAHAMPIVAGVGGTHSILDGIALGQVLEKDRSGTASAKFTAAELQRWSEGIAESERNLASLHESKSGIVEHL